jgi:hypothetical protein
MTKFIRLLVLLGMVGLASAATVSASAMGPDGDGHRRGWPPAPRTVPEPSELLMLSAGVSIVFGLRRRLSLGK